MDQRAMLEAQMSAKSVGLAAVLALVFGGIGLLYVSILNGLVGIVIEFFLILVMILTAGLGGFLFIPWHIICVIVAMSMAKRHNRRLLDRLTREDSSAK